MLSFGPSWTHCLYYCLVDCTQIRGYVIHCLRQMIAGTWFTSVFFVSSLCTHLYKSVLLGSKVRVTSGKWPGSATYTYTTLCNLASKPARLLRRSVLWRVAYFPGWAHFPLQAYQVANESLKNASFSYVPFWMQTCMCRVFVSQSTISCSSLILV